MPVLIDGDTTTFESTVILEFIEERWPTSTRLPSDPFARAFTRVTEDVAIPKYVGDGACRDHRLEWMIRSGGLDVVATGCAPTTSASPGHHR